MKTYIIASTEYHANMPDMFLMDESGNYYGVSSTSYASWDNYPKDPAHWQTRQGSDEGRFFAVDCIELADEVVAKFDKLTKDYAELDAATPSFDESYPLPADYKTKKAYNVACEEWAERHSAWVKESRIAEFVTRKRDLWEERTKMFASLSEKVYEAIKYHDCFRYA